MIRHDDDGPARDDRRVRRPEEYGSPREDPVCDDVMNPPGERVGAKVAPLDAGGREPVVERREPRRSRAVELAFERAADRGEILLVVPREEAGDGADERVAVEQRRSGHAVVGGATVWPNAGGASGLPLRDVPAPHFGQ